MKTRYILSIDQSTQGTKAMLFDECGEMVLRRDLPHRQLISDEGWVSHDLEEIYQNTLEVVRRVVLDSGIDREQVAAIGLSNQRETSAAWERKSGKPIGEAIVWQCSRAEVICQGLEKEKQMIREITGMDLSPYFPAAKFAWILQNRKEAEEKMKEHDLCLGTIDSFLVFRMTEGKVFRTDITNASRTQLMNLMTSQFEQSLCRLFGIDRDCLPQIEDSDGCYGETTLEGFFPQPVPIRAVMGDSHAALFAQGCLEKGMTKATYGTGSSIMMNVGEQPVFAKNGVVSSVGFKINGKTSYVLEGNLNYTGAVITWLKKDMGLITDERETEELALQANPADKTYLVPAFSGLGAPYWDSSARAAVIGMSRTTGRAEFVKAGLSCIALQITDVVKAMEEASGLSQQELRVDGGPAKNRFLMQLQSDLLQKPVLVPDHEELSGIGAAYAAGLAVGLYEKNVFDRIRRMAYHQSMKEDESRTYYEGWQTAVSRVLEKAVTTC